MKGVEAIKLPSLTITRWSLLRSWVLILKELRNLLPIHSVNYAAKLVHTIRALSIINCHQEPIQVKPATLLIPIDLILFLLVEELYGTRHQSGSFSLIYVGSGFSLPA